MGLEGKVTFTGLVSSYELPQVLKDAECLVLARPDTLQAKYGFPTKLGEYLLTENPVVVTSVGEIPLYLDDHVNAYLTTPGDSSKIASSIIEALTSSTANEIGKAGAVVAKTNFNCEIESQKVISFFFRN